MRRCMLLLGVAVFVPCSTLFLAALMYPSGGAYKWARGGKADQENNRKLGGVHFSIHLRDSTGTLVIPHIADSSTRDYLNDLVLKSALSTSQQTSNVAFVKTHKTASTTLASLLYRYARRHNLKLAHFEGFGSRVDLHEAVAQTKTSGERVDVMHYHMSVFGDFESTWRQAEMSYRQIMRKSDPVNFITVLREPRSHLLSYYYFYLQPNTQQSIEEFLFNPKPNSKAQHRRLYNPLAAEFGIKNMEHLEDFISTSLVTFKLVLLTERFDEGLMVLRRMLNWDIIDTSYLTLFKTRAGGRRYDGKKLSDVPHFDSLRPEVQQHIDKLTYMDTMLYEAGKKQFEKRLKPLEGNVASDLVKFRELQKLVADYMEFNQTSLSKKLYKSLDIYHSNDCYDF